MARESEVVGFKQNEFHNVVGMIVKIYRDPQTEITSLFITDFTINKSLMDYSTSSSTSSWSGPPGQRTLQVSQWGIHRIDHQGRRVEPGMFVRLENVRGKMNSNGLLEATMWAREDDWRSKSMVISENGNFPIEWKKKIGRILKRQKVYEENQRRQSSEGEEEILASQHFPSPASNKRSNESGETDYGLSKRPKPAAAITSWKLVHDPPISPSYVEPAAMSNFEQALSSTKSVCHYLKGKIVDFYPDVLEEWIVGSCPVCANEFSQKEIVCSQHDRASWNYFFAFKIESPDELDEKGNPLKLTVEVEGNDADSLFPSTLRATLALRTNARPLEDLLRGLLDGLQTAKRDKKELSSEWDGSVVFEFVVEGMGKGRQRSFKFSDMKFAVV